MNILYIKVWTQVCMRNIISKLSINPKPSLTMLITGNVTSAKQDFILLDTVIKKWNH